MTADETRTGNPDRQRSSEDTGTRAWTARFSVTARALRDTVERAGGEAAVCSFHSDQSI